MTTLQHVTLRPTAQPSAASRWLTAGLVAGPLYVGVSLSQALTRDGFDLTRHAWSTLANGSLGWIQMANLAVTGLLVLTVAVGLRTVLDGGPGSRWAPRGLTIFGAGMIAASLFQADPSLGFPAGTPADYRAVSWHGTVHMMAASTAFAGAIVAILALARRFARTGRRGAALASRAVAVFFVTSFLGLAGTGGSVGVVAFTIGIVAVFGWLAAVAAAYRTA